MKEKIVIPLIANKKLILGVTVGGSSRLLDGQVNYFRNLGYDVFLLSPPHYKEKLFCERENCYHLPVNIVKNINPIKDLTALWQIIKYLKKLKPDIVNVGTPKMGLLGILGAFFAGVKIRIYTCRGLRFETEKGILRLILITMEKLTVFLATKVIYVSPSLKNAALKYGTENPNKSVVLERGSSNGVDLSRFNPKMIDKTKRNELFEKFELKNCFTIGFVGRVSRHKGAYEMVEAFEELYKSNKNIRLIMIGHDESTEEFRQKYLTHPGIIYIPFQDDIPLYMSLFDVFILPSWREGFPNVPIQAAAMGLPVIVSNSTGCIDSVNDNFNGLIFQIKDKEALESALLKYMNDNLLIKKHGSNGIIWAKNFENRVIWDALNNLYIEML